MALIVHHKQDNPSSANVQSYCCKVGVTGPLLHESPKVDQNGISYVGNINVSSTITALHLEVGEHFITLQTWDASKEYLQPPTGILEEQCDRAIVHVFSTPQLSWLDLNAYSMHMEVKGLIVY